MGWGVIIETDEKDTDGKPWFVGYHHLHCADHGINCKGPQVHGAHSPLFSTKVGDRKELGDPVGRIGNSGSASSGPHGHFTLSKTLKGAWNGKVYDLHAKIKAEQKKAPKPAVKAPQTVKPSDTPEPQIIFACPHCKKELK
jgi:hypothetical protein